MLFVLSGSSFKRALSQILGTSSKKSVNFTFSKGKLRLQTSDIIIIEDTIDILEQDCDSESFTAVINNAVTLLDDNYTVKITIMENTMIISQMLFSYTVAREYADAIEYDLKDTEYKDVDIAQLSGIDKDLRAIDAVTRSFGMESVEVNIYKGVCYVDGKSLAYMSKFDFPDMAISSKTIKELKRVLKKSEMAMKGNIVEFRQDTKRILTDVLPVDIQTVNSLNNLKNGLKLLVQDFEIESYSSSIETIYKIYKNILLDITICEDGMIIATNNEKIKLVTGRGSKKLCTIQLSIYQALCMSRIFNSGSNVDIYGGSNKICLISKSSKRVLILAGTIF